MRILGALILSSLLVASVAIAKVKKDEPIIQQVSEDVYVSKGDIQNISNRLNYWFLSIIGFIAIELYRAYQRKNDTTGATLVELVKLVESMRIQMDHMVTRDEARHISRDELKHMLDLSERR